MREKTLSIAFKKDFFKLISNRINGKTIKTLRKIVKVRLVNSAKDYTNSGVGHALFL